MTSSETTEPVVVTEPEVVLGRESVVVDPSKPTRISTTVHKDHLVLAAQKAELETNVQYCLAAGIEWLEVDQALITHLCNGKFPDERYMIYKNVRLCLPGEAETIARKEALTIHEILFKDDKLQYRVGKAR